MQKFDNAGKAYLHAKLGIDIAQDIIADSRDRPQAQALADEVTAVLNKHIHACTGRHGDYMMAMASVVVGVITNNIKSMPPELSNFEGMEFEDFYAIFANAFQTIIRQGLPVGKSIYEGREKATIN